MSLEQTNDDVIAQFREYGGEIKEGIFKDAPILLLTTVGARTGKAYLAPLVYLPDGDRYVIIASKGGAPTHPAWYHNLLANPIVTVEVGREKFTARATPVEGAERRRLYDAQAALRPAFARYERMTTREIPVVVLERV
jgi:deazaflavin-dependent oxidoreductase (nitroreductase family)